ncbi:MAG TPA: capsule assembly Wzi family protein [Terracidiphilus sp.]|jgi:hypothetical protein|nr:capsule assembly Wzi family protein [Terracidiphilus sp.]
MNSEVFVKALMWLCVIIIGTGGQMVAGAQASPSSQATAANVASIDETGYQGSTYVPLDNWVYPVLDRLHALGYVDTAFLGLRPWTRLGIALMLAESADAIQTDSGNDEARAIYAALQREFQPDIDRAGAPSLSLESVYTDVRGISGTPLRDSFHLGQSLVNDYGRPYQAGFNDYSGFSARAADDRFSLYLRAEFQHSPSSTGYSPALAALLSNNIDDVPFATNPSQDTIPSGPIPVADSGRVLEANFSYHLLGHEASIGKSDHWLGPAQGASMLWSNNAENIYDFEINRVEPLHIPFLSKLTGPFRYDFFVGSLKGHTYPNDPWVHMEKISFKPSRNLELGFDRMAIWGGKGHAPITLHTFLHSFFSFQNVTYQEKNSASDPGYRLGTFDFSYRLPLLRRWVTLYTDSLAHDDVSPVSAPRRAGYRPGIYLARFPGAAHLDLRIEGATTDTVSSSFQSGQFLYWESIQRQGPTNKGFLVGDWVGRQGKGGQGWLTYHLSPQEQVQFSYRRAKASSAFIPGGTTQDDYAFDFCKRVRPDVEIRGFLQWEQWKAPVFMTGSQHDLTVETRITWFPRVLNRN